MAYNTVQMGTNLNDYIDFNYLGNTQAIHINRKAYYKLEVWGAGGGGGSTSDRVGGAGGYACGYKLFDVGTTIYVRVGQAGFFNNGNPQCSRGGESSHFATIDGTIAAMGEGNKSKLLVVAGGGGGAAGRTSGGAGGGEQGGNAFNFGGSQASRSNAGTQTGPGYGGSWGAGQNETSAADGNGGGGGGGLWGGGNGYYDSNNNSCGGGGGSGYVGGVPQITHFDITMSPANTQGGFTGSGGTGGGTVASRGGTNGKAKITFAYYCDIPIWYTPKGGSAVHLERLFFNGTEVQHCYFEGTKLY